METQRHARGAGLLSDPWAVKDWDFPRGGAPAEKLRFLLNYAVLAPSGHNTQPWLFGLSGDEVALYADRTRALPVADPADRELVMSCGAALFHLRVALRHFGYAPDVHLFPNLDAPDLLARVRLGPHLDPQKAPTMEDQRLFMAIKQRRTNRKPFEARPVPQQELKLLQAAAEAEGARLHVVTEAEQKGALADLIARGDRLQGSNASFRRELAAWVHPNRSRRSDGMPGAVHGIGDVLSHAGPLVVRTFDWGGGQAARDRQLAEGAPALLVLCTRADGPPAHLVAGQALDRVLLTATAYGLGASYLNQPLQVEALRPKVAAVTGGGYPQIILRLGYGGVAVVPATPRRPVHHALVHGPSR